MSSAADLIESLRPLNPGRRFAIAIAGDPPFESALAIDGTNGWDMFAAATLDGKWVQCLIPSIQERSKWTEVLPMQEAA